MHVYKKVKTVASVQKNIWLDASGEEHSRIVKLFIPDGAWVRWTDNKGVAHLKKMTPKVRKLLEADPPTEKARASRADVVAVEHHNGKTVRGIKAIGIAGYDEQTAYFPGHTLTPNGFTKSRHIICGRGVHFFFNREEALGYNL